METKLPGVNRPSGSGSVTIGSIIDDDATPDAWELGRGLILKCQGERQIQVYEDLLLPLDAPLTLPLPLPLGLFIA